MDRSPTYRVEASNLLLRPGRHFGCMKLLFYLCRYPESRSTHRRAPGGRSAVDTALQPLNRSEVEP